VSTPDHVNKKRLRELYSSDSAAKAVFDHLAARKNNWRELRVDRLIHNLESEGPPVSRADVTRVFKALERAGCGAYVVGRKGRPSRFRWDVQMVEVAKHAAGEAAVIERIDSDAADDDDAVPSNDDADAAWVTHGFRLRPELLLSFKLPTDLTVAEAGRLSDFLKTLPFAA
jgi:hypothetical protein